MILSRNVMIIGVMFALTSVVLGAFSAHALKNILSPASLNLFEVASRYQMYHALGLIICGMIGLVELKVTIPKAWLHRSAVSFISGIFLFCGSLYLLPFTSIKWIGIITPVGGVLFILGWIFLLLVCLKSQLKESPNNDL